MEDVGLSALAKIYGHLLIDEQWAFWDQREFSWIGHRLQQTVQASLQFADGDLTLSRLAANCNVVDDVSEPPGSVLRTLSRMNRHAVGSAYNYWPPTRTIWSNLVAYVHDDTLEWRSKQFSAFVNLQLCLAETEADWLAAKTGGNAGTREHPMSGRRAVADDILNVPDSFFAESGQEPSRFSDKFEMETIAEVFERSTNAASLGGSADGVAFEVSFADQTSLIMLKTGEPHRRLGSGLTVRLHLPIEADPEDADRIAAALNTQEASGAANATHFGAWCWDDWPTTGQSIAYQLFIPNLLYQPGVAQDIAYSFVVRARWVDRVLNGQQSDKSVWKTIHERYGNEPPDGDEG